MPIKTLSPAVKIVKKSLPSVVSITMTKNLPELESIFKLSSKDRPLISKKGKTKVGGGSGFIVSKDGIVLTNRHVMEDSKADYTFVLHNGEKAKPKILGIDEIHDIAILKIEPLNEKSIIREPFSFLEMGDSNKLDLGEEVIAIGNALGLLKTLFL